MCVFTSVSIHLELNPSGLGICAITSILLIISFVSSNVLLAHEDALFKSLNKVFIVFLKTLSS